MSLGVCLITPIRILSSTLLYTKSDAHLVGETPYKLGSHMNGSVKNMLARVLRHATLNSGPGSWIFVSRGKNRFFFSSAVAKQLPTSMRRYVRFGQGFNAIIRMVPAGNLLFRHAATRAFGESAPILQLKFGEDCFALLGDDPRMVIVAGDTYAFKSKLSAQIAARSDLIVDVGANYGSFSRAAVSISSTIQPSVLAIEPNPRLHDALVANLRHGGVKRFAVRQCALGAETSATHSFAVPSHSSGEGKAADSAMMAREKGKIEDLHITVVSQETLDEQLERPEISRLNPETASVFLKIDVEGAEAAVLEGGHEFLGRFRPAIYLEVNNAHTALVGGDIQRVVASLMQHGYTDYVREGDSMRSPVRNLADEKGKKDVILTHPRSVVKHECA